MIFYTLDDGSNGELNLVPYTQFANVAPPDWATLYDRGTIIEDKLNKLIRFLAEEGPNQSSLSIRLQNGLAAACSNIPLDEFDKLSDFDKTFHRRKCAQLWSPDQNYPQLHVSVYLGGPRNNSSTKLSSSPSLSSRLNFAKALPHEDQNTEFAPWHDDWDGLQSPAGCSWGWHTPTFTAERDYIFLSGAFVAWYYQCAVALKERLSHSIANSATRQQATNLQNLDTFLQVTLYHELVHISRTKIWASQKNTPQNIVDHPKANCGSPSGEAGRLAERIAFGSVVNLLKNPENDLVLYSKDFDMDPSASYALTQDVADGIFQPAVLSPLISFKMMRQDRQAPLSQSVITAWERSKSKGVHGPTQVVDNIDITRVLALPKRQPNPVTMFNEIEIPPWESPPYKGGCVRHIKF